jgi:hypothetical protein
LGDEIQNGQQKKRQKKKQTKRSSNKKPSSHRVLFPPAVVYNKESQSNSQAVPVGIMLLPLSTYKLMYVPYPTTPFTEILSF